jgi:hypothetical protein
MCIKFETYFLKKNNFLKIIFKLKKFKKYVFNFIHMSKNVISNKIKEIWGEEKFDTIYWLSTQVESWAMGFGRRPRFSVL